MAKAEVIIVAYFSGFVVAPGGINQEAET